MASLSVLALRLPVTLLGLAILMKRTRKFCRRIIAFWKMGAGNCGNRPKPLLRRSVRTPFLFKWKAFKLVQKHFLFQQSPFRKILRRHPSIPLWEGFQLAQVDPHPQYHPYHRSLKRRQVCSPNQRYLAYRRYQKPPRNCCSTPQTQTQIQAASQSRAAFWNRELPQCTLRFGISA